MPYPDWIVKEVRKNKTDLRGGASLKTADELAGHRLRTVCEEALCPNKGRCFSEGEATFLILGDICTRACSFCAVTKKTPLPPDPGEPVRAAELLKKWGLKYVVFTSPTRDDLPDGGASHFAKTVSEIKKLNPGLKTEPLIPDFNGLRSALETVLHSGPSVLGHNIETTAGLHEKVRAGADYKRSLELLARSKKIRPDIFTKSGIMLGLGETDAQIESTLEDLLAHGCDLLTIGQYLAPSKNHFPVKKYYTPEEFSDWGQKARKMGFKAALSGPLVRSSYQALSLYRAARLKVYGN
ncbi:MAG: lipoyl synthase [Elusimicrobia bacterium GWC2_51_8]|nr:MAG: lipoyl synthase [Elusimicrobia bacterium GWA2_51_34]OGR60438.1 MAG: lipoyl synthase [Elusimicrobia bacterium GWC2_51_8]OGR86489.1 MAG: lipoyl synthase [Elusimicrobia bacterium GWF2_52_66]HAF94725.1 lipoyl synthase [Elusimicrobiota bacterium]HCE97730.1 lipoyl synthase [Elusimicrobiota bacterium]